MFRSIWHRTPYCAADLKTAVQRLYSEGLSHDGCFSESSGGPNSAISTTLQAGRGFAQVSPNESTSFRSNVYLGYLRSKAVSVEDGKASWIINASRLRPGRLLPLHEFCARLFCGRNKPLSDLKGGSRSASCTVRPILTAAPRIEPFLGTGLPLLARRTTKNLFETRGCYLDDR